MGYREYLQNAKLSIDEPKKKLIKEAVFSDGSKFYRIPAEPMPKDQVCIRVRVAKNNVDEVKLIYNQMIDMMHKESEDKFFEFYSSRLTLDSEIIRYCFEIKSGDESYYYDQAGFSNEIRNEFQFSIMPGFKTPDWAKGAVFYQIFVDRFFNGDASNDVLDREYIYLNDGTTQVKDWFKYPDKAGVREFYGGDILGILKKLDYLKELGVQVLYLNPIFVSPSNHKYDIQDYDYVDPHFGFIRKDEGECLRPDQSSNKEAYKYISRVTVSENLEASNQLFIQLVEEVHKRGMRVILDGVFNHCGSFNKWLDKEGIYENAMGYQKGAYVDANSIYHSFFRFNQDSWPYNDSYDGWWGHDTLPKLNYESSQKLFSYIMKIAKKWVSPPYNVDGWRLDVAADLGHSEEYNHYFWKEFRKAVKEANPEALILAEHYGDPYTWLQGDEWDTVMNYDAFMEPITWFLTGVEKHSDDYNEELFLNADAFYMSMTKYMAKFNTQSLHVAMNELSNHDHSRFLTRTNQTVGRITSLGHKAAEEGINPAIMREAVIMQMTWPGAPTIYYGDEAGLCGFTDPDNRRTYPWDRENKEMIRLHKEIIAIHKAYDALKIGSIKFLGGFHGVLYYGRFDDTDKFVIVINNNSNEVEVNVPVWEIGISDEDPMVRMIYTNEEGFGVDTEVYLANQGMLFLKMPAFSSLVLKNLSPWLCQRGYYTREHSSQHAV